MFSEKVIHALQYYVYRLIDPRNGECFYVGKGEGNRVFQHVQASKAFEKEVDQFRDEEAPIQDLKFDRIRKIRKAGLDVVHVIHRHGMNEETAFAVEAALIDAYQGLSNQQGGHGSNQYGPLNAKEAMALYDLPPLSDLGEDKVIFININVSFDSGNTDDHFYNAVRFAWRLSKDRARKADYVVAVVRGVTKAVFVPERWLEATKKNFPNFSIQESDASRIGFEGKRAPSSVQERYVGENGKRLDAIGLKHNQNPIRYWNC